MDLGSFTLGLLSGSAAIGGLARLREHGVTPAGLSDLLVRAQGHPAWTDLLGHFAAVFDRLKACLAGRLLVERLTADALLTHLYECLTGLPRHPARSDGGREAHPLAPAPVA